MNPLKAKLNQAVNYIIFCKKLVMFATITHYFSLVKVRIMSILERLTQRVDELLNRLDELHKEIEALRLENSALVSERSEKDRQINALYEELANRDRSYENLINKIDEAKK